MASTSTQAITDELIEQVQQGSAEMSEGAAVALAGELYTRGRYRQAVNVCRQIIGHNPRQPDAHNIMGVALAALGNADAGIGALEQAIELAPRAASYHANLGEVLRTSGHGEKAAAHLQRSTELDPNNAQALNNLGILHYEREEFDAAVDAYRRALKVDAKLAEAWNNLGNSLRRVGEKAAALDAYENALALRSVYPEAYNNLGTLLRELKKNEQAEHALKKAVEQSPRYEDAHNNLAASYFAEGKDIEALRQLSEVLKFAPENTRSLLLTARIQLKRSSYDLAERACRHVLRIDGNSAEALTVLGQIKHETDDYTGAVALLEKAVLADPTNAEARNFYGVTLKSTGRLEAAREQILQAIELNENLSGAYANLNDLIDYSEHPELRSKIEGLLASSDPLDSDRHLPLHYAYAKALEDSGDYPAALTHYVKGGEIRRAQLSYTEADAFAFFDRIKAAFPAELFAERPFAGNSSSRPVFIIGMPRSGSTLVEQILSSHPEVHGAGEVKYLSRQLHALRDRFPMLSRYPEIIHELKLSQFTMLADGYLEKIEVGAGKAQRITDKLLTHYLYAGLIHLLFPQAKIINTLRNPVDNCLSAFTKLFKDDMPHSYDLGELGRYYRKYEELMAHWKAVLPEGVLATVQYEDMVADTEGTAKTLIEFIGLPWDKRCLEFHSSDRPVKTASVAQVRKPIYQSAVNRWEKYGAGLKPLLDALGATERLRDDRTNKT